MHWPSCMSGQLEDMRRAIDDKYWLDIFREHPTCYWGRCTSSLEGNGRYEGIYDGMRFENITCNEGFVSFWIGVRQPLFWSLKPESSCRASLEVE